MSDFKLLDLNEIKCNVILAYRLFFNFLVAVKLQGAIEPYKFAFIMYYVIYNIGRTRVYKTSFKITTALLLLNCWQKRELKTEQSLHLANII